MPEDRPSIVEPILSETRNCWKVVRADRAALIIDAERYFRALRESLLQARTSVFIIGWDIHSELRLVRDEKDDGFPKTLGALLDEIVKRQPTLRIHVLSWDFSMIYAMEREFFPTYKLRWKSHDRVRFCLDGEHPVGASQHQKLVVVDDGIAFCGGIDLSQWRWDTSAHRIDDHRRVDPDGKPYPPFHDVQMAVEGEAAYVLGALARHRWRAAAGEEPEGCPDRAHSTLWPPSLEPDFTEVQLAIARTMPPYKGREEIREVEHRKARCEHPTVCFGEQHCHAASGLRQLVSMRSSNSRDEPLASQASQIVGRLPRRVWCMEHPTNAFDQLTVGESDHHMAESHKTREQRYHARVAEAETGRVQTVVVF